jgi:hypothetical protein
MLFTILAGKGAEPFLEKTLHRFLDAGADCLVVQYDDSELPIPKGAEVRRDSGQKWQLARRHLTPEKVADYDYVFIWDDDIDLLEFDPRLFVEIMAACNLDCAQPAIVSEHGIMHEITKAQALHPSSGSHLSVGRLTNFVEIMVPVYSRQAWLDFWPYLTDESASGHGYDYFPFNRRGIVDLMPVHHTRACQSHAPGPNDLINFTVHNGVYSHEKANMGLLLVDAVPDGAGGGAFRGRRAGRSAQSHRRYLSSEPSSERGNGGWGTECSRL